MKTAVLLLVMVAVVVLVFSGPALASVQTGRAASQAAMYAQTWGLTGDTDNYVRDALSGVFVPPTSYTPGGSLPPAPVFQPTP
jgi:hypothetical protein